MSVLCKASDFSEDAVADASDSLYSACFIAVAECLLVRTFKEADRLKWKHFALWLRICFECRNWNTGRRFCVSTMKVPNHVPFVGHLKTILLICWHRSLCRTPSRGDSQQLASLGFEDVSMLAISVLEQIAAAMRNRMGKTAGCTLHTSPNDRKMCDLCCERRSRNKRTSRVTLSYWFVGRRCTSKTVVCARQNRSSVHVERSGFATCPSSFRHHHFRHHYPQHHMFHSIFPNIPIVLFISFSKFNIQLIF